MNKPDTIKESWLPEVGSSEWDEMFEPLERELEEMNPEEWDGLFKEIEEEWEDVFKGI